MRSRSLVLSSILLLVAGAAWASGEQEKDPKEAAANQDAPPAKPSTVDAEGRPRVFTNKDLEKYGKGKGNPNVQIVRTDAGTPASASAATPLPPSAPGEEKVLPPEERLDGTLTPAELRAREAELAGSLDFLRAKERWLKQPFGRPPTPPPGEPLFDPAVSGAEQLRQTRRQIDDTANRLDTVRGLLRALTPTP